MGVYDLILHASQSERISELEERIEDLEKKIVILKEWIDYLEAERSKTNDQS